MAVKRIDLLNASKLLAKEGITKPGDQDNTTALMLGVQYLTEKREGKTDLDFQDWLEGEVEDDDVESETGSEDPTPAP